MKQFNKIISILVLMLSLFFGMPFFTLVAASQKKHIAPTAENVTSATGITFQEFSIHPVWYSINAGQRLERQEMATKFRTICNQLGSTENFKIPKKVANICRVATYNVHFWRNPYAGWVGKDKYDFNQIVNVIKKVDADIFILQEVGGGQQNWDDDFFKTFNEMGYGHIACCSTSEHGVDAAGNLYNCILSKYPFVQPAIKKQYSINPDPSLKNQNPEQRCFVGAIIRLPNKKLVSVYGTHLEVRPIVMRNAQGEIHEFTPEKARKAQLEELVKYINKNNQNDNIIIGADFNGIRKQDLQYQIGTKTLWSLLKESWPSIVQASNIENLSHLVDPEPSSLALDYLAQQHYKDSFAMSNFQPPQFTVWTGTRVDFLFLPRSWNLPIAGSYVFYNWSSDHIPVIMDINIAAKSKVTKKVDKKSTQKAAVKKAAARKKQQAQKVKKLSSQQKKEAARAAEKVSDATKNITA
jgi:endonuclease/exonuclease/phosphatase family metal-dependent hydrolase